MREIIFDTETTGLGNEDQVIEIGCVEMIDMALTGRTFHTYIRPTCRIHPEAQKVHGITEIFLRDKPAFVGISKAFLDFIGDSRLVAHNATFDVTMLNREMERIGRDKLANEIVDTLPLARKAKPGGKHKLDDMLRHFKINGQRDLHGALLDSELLAEVYVELRGGRQTRLDVTTTQKGEEIVDRPIPKRPVPLPSRLTQADIEAHHRMIESLGPDCVWLLYPSCCPKPKSSL